jgi:hypothetical protein
MTISIPAQDPTRATPLPAPVPEIPLDPVPVRYRVDGWTAEKQRGFILVLAECGVARRAAAAVGMSERSAHKLAMRADADSFRNAWDAALQVAIRRGVSLVYEYALEGPLETVWKDGVVAYQRRRPSEKALFFLLTRLDPRFLRPLPGTPDFDPVAANASDLPLHLEVLKELPDDEDYDGPLA